MPFTLQGAVSSATPQPPTSRGTGQEHNQECHCKKQHKRKPKAIAALNFRQQFDFQTNSNFGLTDKFQPQKKINDQFFHAPLTSIRQNYKIKKFCFLSKTSEESNQ